MQTMALPYRLNPQRYQFPDHSQAISARACCMPTPHLSFEHIHISHASAQHMQLTLQVGQLDLQHTDLIQPAANITQVTSNVGRCKYSALWAQTEPSIVCLLLTNRAAL
jgi:hypothetical protein